MSNWCSHKHRCLELTTASHNQQSNSAACRASDNGDDTSHRCRLQSAARDSLRKRDIYYNITSCSREGNVPQVAVEPTNQRCVPCPNLPSFERDSHSPVQEICSEDAPTMPAFKVLGQEICPEDAPMFAPPPEGMVQLKLYVKITAYTNNSVLGTLCLQTKQK